MSEEALASDGAGYVALDHYLRDIDTGKSPVAENTPAGEGEWGVLKVSAVQGGWFQSRENKVIRDAAHIQPRFEVRPGDLLMTRANTEALVGLACIAETPPPRLMLSDKTLRLVVDGDVADRAFVALALLRPAARNQVRAMATGTSAGMKNISQRQIRRLMVPRVSLEQQRRIVAVHAAFERRIGALRKQVDKRTALLSGLAESLLQQRVDKLVALGDVATECQAGVTLGAHRTPRRNAVGYLRVANVRKGWIDVDDIAVLETQERDRPRYELTPGDVLVVEGHANPEQIGRAAVVDRTTSGLLFQNHLFRLRFDDVIPEFAALWLNASAVRSYWRTRCTTSSGLYTINSKLLSEVPFPLIDSEQQRQIVEACQVASRSVESARRQIGKIRVLQAAAVEDLLAG
ncbi:hypothetical protein [Streptomyces sp. NPDC005989]|uniref:restriction endonuclease subunit S n=1 Tax=Streptomyces sp. NPDC005989 TaxID=3156727 RepID=UPI0033CCFAD9